MFLKRFLADERGDFVEAALTLPIILLVTLGLVNMAMLGIAGINANNAANYGARRGSVAQRDATGIAAAATWEKINQAPLGSYRVSVMGGGSRGSRIAVLVSYEVPNFFGGLGAFFGRESAPVFHKQVVSYFRQEGW